MMVGTATYMPPEQALGGAVTPQSDLYALGAKLYLDQVIAKKLELQGVSPADAGPGSATIVADTPALDDTIPAE